jgi:hypothetical protein
MDEINYGTFHFGLVNYTQDFSANHNAGTTVFVITVAPRSRRPAADK